MRHITWQRFKLGLLPVVVLLTLWLVASLVVAHRLTRRSQPPFAEPVPAADWGKFKPHRLKTCDGQEIGAWLVVGAEDSASVLLIHDRVGPRPLPRRANPSGQRRPRELPRLEAPGPSPPRHPPPRRPLSAPARLVLLQELSERVATDLTEMGLRPMIGYDRAIENQGS